MARTPPTTIVDIARRLGVAHSTVSRSLTDSPLISKETKQKVIALAKDLNYTKNPFANGLRTGQTKIIELLYYTRAEHLYEDPLLLIILDCVSHELESQGYKVMLNIHKTDAKQRSRPRLLQHDVTDGTILVSSQVFPTHYRKQIDQTRCVLIDNVLAGCTSVCFDTENNFDLLIRHIMDQKRSCICALTMSRKNHYTLRQRVRSYNKICSRYKKQITNLGIIEVDIRENPFPALRQLDVFPDAIIPMFGWDGLLEFAKREHIAIPQDLFVAAITEFDSPLSSNQAVPRIALNWQELVRKAVKSLIAQIKGAPPSKQHHLIRSPLILPDSLSDSPSKSVSKGTKKI